MKNQHHFKAYSSIENHYQEFAKNLIRDENYDPSIPWVVSEKIHGCNFSFVMWRDNYQTANSCLVEDIQCQVASRRQYVGLDEEEKQKKKKSPHEDDDFFPEAVEIVRNRYEEQIKKVFKSICDIYSNDNFKVRRANFYGEIFGGQYPHDQIENVKGRYPIQKHVYYTPDYDFYMFDVYVFGLNVETKKEEGFYLAYDKMIQLLTECGISRYAKEVMRGTLEECLEYDCNYPTKIPQLFYNLPLVESCPNICEGVVIKPIRDMFTKEKGERFIIKKKNEAFKEVVQPKKPPRPRKKTKKPTFDNESVSTPVFDLIVQYLNDNRLESAISKIGNIITSFKLRNKCLALFVQDILADFKKEHSNEWDSLAKVDQKAISKYLSDEAKEIITDYVYEYTTEEQKQQEEQL
ncbi:predicted protein [Naegleria gruberi]|uniref:Predicted protein n=1 Tax=Naegleria gruberi TaxID=5762 RepID=D2VTK7_NAEGR|nr:uncharacterized protein NAEGRDRAFT_52138 [Naegleria gruberi]EFC39947.1 predicted protein [Naegleria gruberi]|eukprot:XP_002672691.1 predicted protein [Naegleria gruberi strain NEG-M]